MKPDEKLPFPSDVKTDDPLCSGKKSQPPDVAVDELKKSNFLPVELSRNYNGVSGRWVKLSRIREKLLIIKKKPNRNRWSDGLMNGKRCCARKWLHGKKSRCCMIMPHLIPYV